MDALNMSNLKINSSALLGDEYNLSDVDLPEDAMDKHIMTEYREDLWNNLLKSEEDKPRIRLQSPQLQFRGALVCELRRYIKKLGLSYGTLHMAVWLLDLFMDSHELRSDRLTDITIVCLCLAAKSEERGTRIPSLQRIKSVTGHTVKGLSSLEYAVASNANWKLSSATSATAARVLAPITSRKDLQRLGDELVRSFLDLTLSDVRLSTARASRVGAACVCAARTVMGLTSWTQQLYEMTGLHETTVSPIADLLLRMRQLLKSRDIEDNSDGSQGYFSGKSTPTASPSRSIDRSPTDEENRNYVHTLVPVANMPKIIFQYPGNNLDHYQFRVVRTKHSNVGHIVQLPTKVPTSNNRINIELGPNRSRKLVNVVLDQDRATKKRRGEESVISNGKRICKSLQYAFNV